MGNITLDYIEPEYMCQCLPAIAKFFCHISQAPLHTLNCKQIIWRLNMSDLAATNCGGCGCGCGNDNGGCNCLFILLILLCCGGNNWNNNGCGCGDSAIWIILLLFCCGGNGNNVLGCGC